MIFIFFYFLVETTNSKTSGQGRIVEKRRIDSDSIRTTVKKQLILTTNGSTLLVDANNGNEFGYNTNVGYMNNFDYSIGQNQNTNLTESPNNFKGDHDCDEKEIEIETGNDVTDDAIPIDIGNNSFLDQNGSENDHVDASGREIEPGVFNIATELAKINFKLDAILKWTGKSGGTVLGKYSLPLKSLDELSGWDEEVSGESDALHSAVCFYFYLCIFLIF